MDRASPAWLVIARREFLERVRTKWFVIVTILGPVGLLVLTLLPAYLGKKAAEERVAIAVVDRSGHALTAALAEAAPALGANLALEEVAADTAEEVLRGRIRDQQIQGYLVIPPDVMDSGVVLYRGDNATNFGLQIRLQGVVTIAVQHKRASGIGLSIPQRIALLRQVPIDTKHTTGEGEAKSAVESYLVGLVVMMILYMAILLYAVNVMRSVVQEKTSRVVEIIVSATRPSSLMAGKVLGVGSVGLLQLAIWAAAALLLVKARGGVLGLLGVTGVPAELPFSIGASDVALILGYFLGGYFFFASLYAALGAMVNSEQEAQQVQTPVVLLLVVPVVMSQLVASDPRGAAAEILTLLPFSSPVLMPMRWVLDGASWVDVVVSLGILAGSTAGVVYLAARIYRVGILMYGKRPSLRELGHWLRYR
jgi:ABC-2 type transport system permease protein